MMRQIGDEQMDAFTGEQQTTDVERGREVLAEYYPRKPGELPGIETEQLSDYQRADNGAIED